MNSACHHPPSRIELVERIELTFLRQMHAWSGKLHKKINRINRLNSTDGTSRTNCINRTNWKDRINQLNKTESIKRIDLNRLFFLLSFPLSLFLPLSRRPPPSSPPFKTHLQQRYRIKTAAKTRQERPSHALKSPPERHPPHRYAAKTRQKRLQHAPKSPPERHPPSPVRARHRKLQVPRVAQSGSHMPQLDVLQSGQLPRNLAEHVVIDVPCLRKRGRGEVRARARAGGGGQEQQQRQD